MGLCRSIESSAIVNIEKKYGIFLDGEFQTANSKKFLKTISPSTEEVLSQLQLETRTILIPQLIQQRTV